ncbi:MAG: trypsin-like peptidase domain-containing protein [Microcystaceae cyanobacterium]
MKKFIILILSTTLSVILSSQVILAQSFIPLSVEDNARDVTVSLIQILSDGKELKAGTGFLIAKEDDWYDVLTVAHNLRLDEPEIDTDSLINSLRIKTDGNSYRIGYYQRIRNRKLGKLDLVILRFKSDQTYATGTFLNRQNQPVTQNQLSPRPQDTIYVAGFPQSAESFRIDSGRFLEFMGLHSNRNDRLLYSGGYSLRYQASQETDIDKGMSGGAVFNRQGEIIGIHGRQELWRNTNKLAIDINTFWESIPSDLRNRILK